MSAANLLTILRLALTVLIAAFTVAVFAVVFARWDRFLSRRAAGGARTSRGSSTR
jgi:hypothetical protein